MIPSLRKTGSIGFERAQASWSEMAIFLKLAPSKRDLLSKLADYGLSKRQQEVVVWAIRGLSNRQIAEQLFIAEQTVKDHLHDVFGMMKIHRRSELAAKVLGLKPKL